MAFSPPNPFHTPHRDCNCLHMMNFTCYRPIVTISINFQKILCGQCFLETKKVCFHAGEFCHRDRCRVQKYHHNSPQHATTYNPRPSNDGQHFRNLIDTSLAPIAPPCSEISGDKNRFSGKLAFGILKKITNANFPLKRFFSLNISVHGGAPRTHEVSLRSMKC
jgi:hypothetical protein